MATDIHTQGSAHSQGSVQTQGNVQTGDGAQTQRNQAQGTVHSEGTAHTHGIAQSQGIAQIQGSAQTQGDGRYSGTGEAAAWPADAGPDPVLACRDLRYSYLGRFPALDGVSFDVCRGEKLALLGANGCGKSTLLKMLDGLVFPDSGTVHAFGERLTEDSLEDEQFNRAFRSRVGFVFQNSDAQVFSPTVREEVAFGCLQLGLGSAQAGQRTDDVLAMLGIAGLADRAPFQLSGGEKKRVAIASVLVMNPEVLLFDEPTAALDPRTQHWLVELIVELNAAGKTIVLATHDLHALEVLADRCLVLTEDHRLARTGTPAEILADRELLLEVNLVHPRSQPAGP